MGENILYYKGIIFIVKETFHQKSKTKQKNIESWKQFIETPLFEAPMI